MYICNKWHLSRQKWHLTWQVRCQVPCNIGLFNIDFHSIVATSFDVKTSIYLIICFQIDADQFLNVHWQEFAQISRNLQNPKPQAIFCKFLLVEYMFIVVIFLSFITINFDFISICWVFYVTEDHNFTLASTTAPPEGIMSCFNISYIKIEVGVKIDVGKVWFFARK